MNTINWATPTAQDDQTDLALQFLFALRRKGPWVLATIDPDKGGAPIVRSFTRRDEAAMRAFIERYNGRANLYFMPNLPLTAVSRKPREDEIAFMNCAYVDLDPVPGESPAEAKARHMRGLLKLEKPPTLAWSTGNGMAAVWKMADPVPLSDESVVEACKAINIALAASLGGKAAGADSVQNLDRLLRLPFTQNIPDARKRAKGRVAIMAGDVIYSPECLYSEFDFPEAVATANEAQPPEIGDPSDYIPLDTLPVSERIKAIIRDGCVADEVKPGDNSRSAWRCEVVCALLRADVAPEDILSLLIDERYAISERALEMPNPESYARREIQRLAKRVASDKVVDFDDDLDEEGDLSTFRPNKGDPYEAARVFKAQKHPSLIHHSEEWLEHDGSRYCVIEEATLRAELYSFLCSGMQPTQRMVTNAVDALKAVAHVPKDTYVAPCWLDNNGPFAATEVLAFAKGLLHLPSGQFVPSTPNFFSRHALDYDYESEACMPRAWNRYLLSVFKGSRGSIGLLQEIIGYLLLQDTSLQKAFIWDSPPRGGKGTTLRIIEKLTGKHNCASPTLSNLGKDAILASMIGKSVAFISDMRIDHHTNLGVVAENLLRITGEDTLTFDRKFIDAWTGKLTVRFFIATNLPPSIPDVSGALTNRFVPLVSRQSFLGREDPDLEAKLSAELPGILLWAIRGWRRLKARGRFKLPPESEAMLRRIADTTSPVSAFIRDRCVLEANASIPKQALLEAWESYADEQDHRSGSLATFARNLYAAAQGKVSD